MGGQPYVVFAHQVEPSSKTPLCCAHARILVSWHTPRQGYTCNRLVSPSASKEVDLKCLHSATCTYLYVRPSSLSVDSIKIDLKIQGASRDRAELLCHRVLSCVPALVELLARLFSGFAPFPDILKTRFYNHVWPAYPPLWWTDLFQDPRDNGLSCSTCL